MITGPYAEQHPAVNILMRSLTSKEIQRGLDTFDLEAGITYLDNEPLENVRTRPLYRERFFLIEASRDARAGGDSGQVTWRDAARLPLCLLSRDMQNRRIIDAVFRSLGCEPRAQIEANSPLSLLAHVRDGNTATILPHGFLSLIAGMPGLRMRRMIDPEPNPQVGLVYSDREPVPAVVKTLLNSIRRLDMQRNVDLAAGLG
jgi:DNA-binding transcriptional LysR family regulator